MKTTRKILLIIITNFILVCGLFLIKADSVHADEPIVIVIDPGHGGENLGAQYAGYTEKDMTLILAKAMKAELEKYENVEVYLTLETDADMSIKDRAAFAAEKNADFLFCLHFNMSVQHNLYGAEVWVPATSTYFSRGYAFAEIEMADLTELGLYSRGIKTKINNENKNYYGILRYCTEYEVPAVLIEHCHLDHEKDQPYYQNGEDKLLALGVLDATAVAKYFRLSSNELGVDYSDYQVPECEVPDGVVHPDLTEPTLCEIEVTDIQPETGEVTIHMKAEDPDSYILYCNYSLDGGNTYSDLMEWPRPQVWNQSLTEHTFTITVPYGRAVDLRVNAYNGFDVWAESSVLQLEPIEDPAIQEELKKKELEEGVNYEEIVYEPSTEQEVSMPSKLWVIVLIALIVILMIFVTIFMAMTINKMRKGRKRR